MCIGSELKFRPVCRIRHHLGVLGVQFMLNRGVRPAPRRARFQFGAEQERDQEQGYYKAGSHAPHRAAFGPANSPLQGLREADRLEWGGGRGGGLRLVVTQGDLQDFGTPLGRNPLSPHSPRLVL